MKGLLLAAGVGKRLKPLTDTAPKPLLPLAGKPILEWVILGLRNAGVNDIAIITGHLEDQIKAQFRSGESLGVSLSYFTQDVQNGTAGAVLPALEFLSGQSFFMSYGDILVHPTIYRHMVMAHECHPEGSLISGREVEDPSSGGVLLMNGDRLADIIEKPTRGTAPGNLINAGLMIFQPDILTHIQSVEPSPRGELELTDAIVSLAKVSPVRVHIVADFWSDIGTHEKLKEADAWASANLSYIYSD